MGRWWLSGTLLSEVLFVSLRRNGPRHPYAMDFPEHCGRPAPDHQLWGSVPFEETGDFLGQEKPVPPWALRGRGQDLVGSRLSLAQDGQKAPAPCFLLLSDFH